MINEKIYYPFPEKKNILGKKEEKIVESVLFNIEEIFYGRKIEGMDRIIMDSFKYKNYDC
jgi:hypothetical protein